MGNGDDLLFIFCITYTPIMGISLLFDLADSFRWTFGVHDTLLRGPLGTETVRLCVVCFVNSQLSSSLTAENVDAQRSTRDNIGWGCAPSIHEKDLGEPVHEYASQDESGVGGEPFLMGN